MAGGEIILAGGKIILASGENILAGGKFFLAGGEIILAGGEIILAGGEIILTGGEIQKRTRREILSIDSQIESPKSGNNFIAPLNLEVDWSSPDNPARVLADVT